MMQHQVQDGSGHLFIIKDIDPVGKFNIGWNYFCRTTTITFVGLSLSVCGLSLCL